MRHVIAALEFSLSVYLILDLSQPIAHSTQFLVNWYKNQVFLHPNNEVECEYALCNVSDQAKKDAIEILAITRNKDDHAICMLHQCLNCTQKQIVTLK